MDYYNWCQELERRYDTMPTWYWSPTVRRNAYETEVKMQKELFSAKNLKSSTK